MDSLKKIMVVDDEAGIRGLLSDVLTSVGFNVTLAKDGQESLDQMQDRRFDLLITDIHMPLKNGFEMMEAIRIHDSEIKTIYMSADPFSFGTRLRAEKEIYGTDLLNKPFTREDLLQTLSSLKN